MKKRTDGRFCRTLTYQGRKIFVYGDTKEEADNKWMELKREKDAFMQVGVRLTLDQWTVEWYDVHKRKRGAIKTQLMYKSIINTHIHPALGHLHLKEIRNIQLQRFLNSIEGSKSLVTKVRLTLQQIFKSALVNGYVMTDPTVGLRVEAVDKPKRKFLTPDQRVLLLDILKNHRAYPFVLLLMYTGMREGEALALTWRDIDLDKRIIRVSKAIEFDGVTPVLKLPKTDKGNRIIPIPSEINSVLQAYREAAQSLYVFPKSPKGGMHSRTSIDNMWKRMNVYIKRYFKEHEQLKPYEFSLTFRMLRHTYATALYDADIDVKSFQEFMGHANINISHEIYTHIQDSRKEDNVRKIDNLFAPKSKSQESKNAR